MSAPRKAKLKDLIHFRLRVTTTDGRQIAGVLLAFDSFMNLVLSDSEEFRHQKNGNEIRRALGLIILRGETVVSLSVEASPSVDIAGKKVAKGTGIATKATGRPANLNLPLAGTSSGFGTSLPTGPSGSANPSKK